MCEKYPFSAQYVGKKPKFLVFSFTLYSSKLKFWLEKLIGVWSFSSLVSLVKTTPIRNQLFSSNQNSNLENTNRYWFDWEIRNNFHILYYSIVDFFLNLIHIFKKMIDFWSKFLISFVSRIAGAHDQTSRSSPSVTAMTRTLTSSDSNDLHTDLAGACVKVRTSEIPSKQFAKKVTIVTNTNTFLAITDEEMMPLV